MKIIGWAIKLIPLITLISGLIGGGTRINPFIDTAKVALTQYELAQITQLVYEDLARRRGPVMEQAQFPTFIRDNFHNQYSVLARELKGDKTHDHSKDIWGKPFHLDYNQLASNLKIFSAGPDTRLETKDDIKANIAYDDGSSQRLGAKKVIPDAPVEEVHEQDISEEREIDPYGQDAYDQEQLAQDQSLEESYEEVEQRLPAAEDNYYDQETSETHSEY